MKKKRFFAINSRANKIIPQNKAIKLHQLYIHVKIILTTQIYFFVTLTTATTAVEFTFDKTMRKQIGGVAKGSALFPALAVIFAAYYEEKLVR